MVMVAWNMLMNKYTETSHVEASTCVSHRLSSAASSVEDEAPQHPRTRQHSQVTVH